jgi:hypothetical protein
VAVERKRRVEAKADMVVAVIRRRPAAVAVGAAVAAAPAVAPTAAAVVAAVVVVTRT